MLNLFWNLSTMKSGVSLMCSISAALFYHKLSWYWLPLLILDNKILYVPFNIIMILYFRIGQPLSFQLAVCLAVITWTFISSLLQFFGRRAFWSSYKATSSLSHLILFLRTHWEAASSTEAKTTLTFSLLVTVYPDPENHQLWTLLVGIFSCHELHVLI